MDGDLLSYLGWREEEHMDGDFLSYSGWREEEKMDGDFLSYLGKREEEENMDGGFLSYLGWREEENMGEDLRDHSARGAWACARPLVGRETRRGRGVHGHLRGLCGVLLGDAGCGRA